MLPRARGVLRMHSGCCATDCTWSPARERVPTCTCWGAHVGALACVLASCVSMCHVAAGQTLATCVQAVLKHGVGSAEAVGAIRSQGQESCNSGAGSGSCAGAGYPHTGPCPPVLQLAAMVCGFGTCCRSLDNTGHHGVQAEGGGKFWGKE